MTEGQVTVSDLLQVAVPVLAVMLASPVILRALGPVPPQPRHSRRPPPHSSADAVSSIIQMWEQPTRRSPR